jgi:error-prone DNA polymerase
MGIWDQTGADYRILGLSPRYHPLGVLRPRLLESLITTVDLEQLDDGTLVRLAGLVVCRQRPGTAKGITFLLMEDECGLANVIVYPNLYETHRLIVRGEPFIIVEGRLQKQDGTINIIAHTIAPLDGARQEVAAPPTKRAEDPPEATGQPTETSVTALSPAAHNYR